MQIYPNKSKVFVICNGTEIKEATVIKFSGGFYTLMFDDGKATRLRESRLSCDKEVAEAKLKLNQSRFSR